MQFDPCRGFRGEGGQAESAAQPVLQFRCGREPVLEGRECRPKRLMSPEGSIDRLWCSFASNGRNARNEPQVNSSASRAASAASSAVRNDPNRPGRAFRRLRRGIRGTRAIDLCQSGVRGSVHMTASVGAVGFRIRQSTIVNRRSRRGLHRQARRGHAGGGRPVNDNYPAASVVTIIRERGCPVKDLSPYRSPRQKLSIIAPASAN